MKMQNKIACSAGQLGVLDPQMIQSVADSNAFHIGAQYVTDKRVRIVEAGDAHISSAVIGNSGLYEQNIKLKDGHLISKCSCTLPEEPMCRHSIAVLLEYHQLKKPRQPRKAKEAVAQGSLPNPAYEDEQKLQPKPRSTPDLKLSEIMLFVEWLEPAMRAIEQETRLPEAPPLDSGDVSTWIHRIKNLEDRRRESEDSVAQLQSEKRDRETFLERLSEQLQASIATAKSAQATSQSLQREIAGYQETLEHVTELMNKMVQSERDIRSSASELLAKTTHFDKLADSFQELFLSLKSTSNQSSHK